jgi:hydroxybutyrate-dimer hydrolase
LITLPKGLDMSPDTVPSPARFPTTRPSYIHGEIKRDCDGMNDDLLTAGMGRNRLAFGTAPAIADPKNPTADELRRLALYTNYRALIDTVPGGGYGVLYGVDDSNGGTSGDSAGRIPGEEYLAFAVDAQSGASVTLMVQIPADFDREHPCIVTAPSSGSRGIYGAVGTVGEWALKHRCAVAYTDEGTGIGAHDLANDTVNLIDGRREKADVAGMASHFTARLGADENAVDVTQRFAFKHAHSQQNPEQDWDKDVLQSIEYAFYLLNQKFGEKNEQGSTIRPTITPENTQVIAAGVSNGGAASLRAAELDGGRLIKGVAVVEPNVNPEPSTAFVIRQGAQAPLAEHSRPLFDYITHINVYQACASLAVGNTGAPANTAGSVARCQSLVDKGLLAAGNLVEQADEAQAHINQYGILREQNAVQPGYWTLYVPQSIAVTYAQAYGRLNVDDPLCGYSFGGTVPAGKPETGKPAATDPAVTMALFGSSNGIPPTPGINLINDRSPGGPLEDRLSFSQSTGRQDQNLDGALRLRELATGVNSQSGQPLTGRMLHVHQVIQRSIADIRASGELHGIPTVIVHGRSDGVIAPNHTSRPYYALAVTHQKPALDNIRYYEITNAHHLDALNGTVEGFNARFVPLHRYFLQALDLLLAHLKENKPLPPSQVVHTTPRRELTPPGAQLAGINAANATLITPPISAAPPVEDRITFDGKVLHIPD